MALSIVQHIAGHGTGNTNPPQSVTLSGAPTQGNLLIAFVQFNTASQITWNSASWTEFNATQAVLGNSVLFGAALYRYVQHGDAAALPNFATATATYWSATVYEISGISGTWTNDFLATIQNQFNDSSHNLATQPMYVPTGTLLLTGFGKYDASNSPTISGSGWTLDEATNDHSNYGGWGAASYIAGSDGFTTSLAVDVIYTGVAPYGYIQAAFIPSGAVIQWPIIRQSTVYAVFSSVPGSVTLVCPPVTGNLLIADVSGGTAVAGTGWTQLATIGTSTATMTRFYRYVQGGDASGLPAVSSSTGSFGVTITEMSYIASTIGNAAFSTKKGTQASGATMTTTADTTPFNDDIVLTTWMNFDDSALITSATSGYYWITEAKDVAITQTWGSQSNVYPSPNSTVQSTATVPNSGVSTTYIQTIFSLNFGSPGTIGIAIGVAGVGTGLEQGAGSIGLNIITSGVGQAVRSSSLTIALDLAVAGISTGIEGSAGAVGMNIAVAGTPQYTFPTKATAALNIAVAGVGTNAAISPGGGDVPLDSKDWKRKWARWKELEEEAIAAEMQRRQKIRDGVVDAFERKVEGKTDPEPEPEPTPFRLPDPVKRYTREELAGLLHQVSIRKYSPSNQQDKDDEEVLLLL